MTPVESPDGLSRALTGWRVSPETNPNFRAEVWARIDRESRAPTWTGYLRANGVLVASALASAVLVGAWTGRGQAREREARAKAELVAEYVHALDSRWMRAP
jgi:hypothetical protein